jgi:DNA invertase Pin-like site-specific DNA recombinase/predicted DNA-binding transcriptional regulator AlpA/transposase
MGELSKVRPAHLRREAWIYVRQSTMTQVRENTESLKRQYELVDRARQLGWAQEQVHVVDEDLGRSGAEASARTGFQSLVAAVGLGQVGLVLGIEVSRLARRNADWYHLLDLCSLTDTLIADGDGVYHPLDYNDRLVLGLKGTMSEAELHVLRSRLDAGLRHKAARGELRQLLPVGLDYDEDGRVVLSADEAVREAIAVVFDRFAELGSARQALLSLRADGLRLPRRSAGSRLIRWAEATYPAVHDFLTNPAYAGAFVFGRRKTVRQVDQTGRIVARERELPREEWEVTIPDHHPGYLCWQTYLANQDRLRANSRPPRGEGGPVREGPALLQGLVVCGKCGRRMLVGYSGKDGRVARYVCAQGLRLYGSARSCQSLSGRRLDAAVVEEMFTVLQPATLTATAAALAEAEDQHARRLRAFELAVERAGYEAERARRQFDAVEPENRLVARSLERDWEARLVAQRRAEAELAAQRSRRPATLTEEEVAWLSHAGADLRGVFDAPSTTVRERKQLLRLLVRELVVTVDTQARQASGTIGWEGGARTSLTVWLPRRGVDGPVRTEADTLERLRRLAAHYDDATIARLLARQGLMTATGLPFTADRVGSLRRRHDIAGPPAEDVGAGGDDAQVVSIAQAEALLGTSRATLYRWLADGFIPGEQPTPGAPWRIRITAELRARIAPENPHGWVGLAEAAQRLGVARQTVLDRIRRGELNAVHVNRGQRKGLAIEIPAQHALFDGAP